MKKSTVLMMAAVAAGNVFASAPMCSSPNDYRTAISVNITDKLGVTVDGRAVEAVWKDAPVIDRLIAGAGQLYTPNGATTKIRLAADAEALYIFAEFGRIKSSTRNAVKAARDKMLPSDTLEFFIKPAEEDRQYQFMFDYVGNVMDLTYTWRLLETKAGEGIWNRAKRDSHWNAEGLVSATVDNGDDGWTLEVELPWKDIGAVAPKPGEKMRMMFARGDYSGVQHNQLSAWTMQLNPNFAQWPDFGTVTFVTDTPVVRAAEIAKDRMSYELEFAGAKRKDAAIRVVVEEQDSAGGLAKIGESELKLAAGETKRVSVALSEETELSWISVFADDELLFRRGGRVPGMQLMIGLRDSLNIREGAIFIPNDANWYTPFVIGHTLTGKSGNRVYGNPPEVDAKIVAEVPEGVTVTKIKYSDWGADLPVRKPLSDEAFERDGKPWRRITLPCFISGVNHALIFFRSTLPAGTKGKYRLYLTWKDGGRQKPVDRDFTVVAYGRVKPFERMQMRLDDLTFNLADAVCGDEPLATELPRLGINVFKIPLYPSKNTSMRYGSRSFKDRLDEFVSTVRTNTVNWYFASMNDLNGLMAWTTEKAHNNFFDLKPDPEACLIDFRGERQRTQFRWWAICPNYRGRNFTDFAKGILSTEAVKDYGVSWAVIDWEYWDLKKPCCCERCRKLWQKWAAERGLPDFGDPREFLKAKGETEAARNYFEFFDWSLGRLYVDLKREVTRGLDLNRTKWFAPKAGAFVFSDWISPRKGTLDGMDFHDCPWAYRAPWDPTGAMRLDAMMKDVTRGRFDQVVCSLNAMQGCEINREFPPVSTYYNILEAAAAGHQGFEWWYVPSFDAETWKYVMDGLRAIRPFEDIILDGQVSLTGRGTGCTYRRVMKNGEALYCVRDYSLVKDNVICPNGETLTGSFYPDPALEGAVWNAATGEKLADLVPGEPMKVTLKFDRDHLAYLLYVGPDFNRQKE